MSFGCRVEDAHRITSFEAAEQYWNAGCGMYRGRSWDNINHERGLGNQRQPHYSIKHKTADTYSLVLYGTDVITYQRPTDEFTTSSFVSSNHAATWQWLWHHTGESYRNRFTTTEGREVLVPIGTCEHTKITTTPDGNLIEALSSPPQIYTWVSTPEDRETRALLRKKLEVIVELAMHRCEWSNEAKTYYNTKAAFDSMLPNNIRYYEKPTVELEDWLRNGMPEPSEAMIEKILNCANVAYNYYAEQPDLLTFRKNYMAWLLREAGANTQRGRKLYPMFPDYASVPKKFFLE